MSTIKTLRGSLALMVGLMLILSGAAWAQTESGNLYGTVTDDQGEELPGVTVTLTGPGAPQVQVTGEEGRFRFLGLSPGNYQLEAALEGFSTVIYEAVNIRIGRNTTIDVTLNAAIEETITVTTESPLLDERKITQGIQVTQLVFDGSYFVGLQAAKLSAALSQDVITKSEKDTRDEVADPGALDIWLELDGNRMQDGNTHTMIFSVATIVSYVSRHMTLLPGDIIPTGTPPGVGMGKDPRRFLTEGDVMELSITGLGRQRQEVGRDG